MRELFVDTKFQAKTLKVIEQADEIMTDWHGQGYTLTLRQLFYQFVSRGLLPNKQTEYKRLGVIVNDARLAGLLDWSYMEDRQRNLETVPSWSSPASIIQAAASGYKEDLWAGQGFRIEVWIEKDALAGVIEGVCKEFRVPYFACRGYTSQSEAYDAGKRLGQYYLDGYEPVVLHLGDHDPSGLDMTRDNRERLNMFAECPVDIRRLALNRDQVDHYNPPPNPAKMTDSRADEYVQEHGMSSWELDALEPSVLNDLIRSEIESLLDPEAWGNALARETENRRALWKVSNRWSDVQAFVEKL